MAALVTAETQRRALHFPKEINSTLVFNLGLVSVLHKLAAPPTSVLPFCPLRFDANAVNDAVIRGLVTLECHKKSSWQDMV